MPENLTTVLRFSIIGSNAKNIEAIKTAFSEIPLRIILTQTYYSAKSFIASSIDMDAIDFIVTDQVSFIEMEEQESKITVPLIIFIDDAFDLQPLHNVVFDTMRLPFNLKKIEKTVKKIEIIKKHFEAKISNHNHDNTVTGNGSKTFLIKKGKEFQLINTDDITLFYTDNKLTFAYNSNGSKFIIQSTLIELESQLSSKSFFRANRQSLINRKYINKIKQLDEGRFEIIIDAVDSLHIDINQQKFSRLKEWIENN
ncbi:LytR/AlgR family response regulator transcription factor [Ferruginibacter sp. SUN106]|uniref:LytR/AlgR family response regulator transcription factor n=1 Tax=Ferruginibacter sp. SUN106 TaxID=2978348 RepID=UPI003D368E6D